MQRKSWMRGAILIASAVVASCVGEVESDSLESFRGEEVIELEGELAEMLMELAVERIPVGEVEAGSITNEDGTETTYQLQRFELIFPDGARAMAGTTCSHSGCSGDCTTSGCNPDGSTCTASSCGSGVGCGIQTATCSKTTSGIGVASAIVAQFPAGTF